MFNPDQGRSFIAEGKVFEEKIFGSGPVDVDFNKPENRKIKTEKYLTLDEALEFVKNNYGEKRDPSDPEKEFANDLHATVAEKLGLDDYSKLKFYCSVGTPADHFHGVDAFFEMEDEYGMVHRVTMDASLKNKSEEILRADVLVGDVPSRKKDRQAYLAQLNMIGDEIVRIFQGSQERGLGR